ncbi:hypothetical protein PYDG_00035 [Pseudoalteromonas phage pYD6-A]|uniref:Uncharacterized protein n=1 Tax=Pseudoalteromonas phage pYD6-A TaxID=754052 RepID=M4SMH3_9CAUD|nr:hypothetical protein PYDG_00035 [Pseudoalteromonas phage pYD6-A]AGH57567.1 hypothetical protein PYDG_00035 [Pseudoalteromonas phage pYD6-A]
MSKLIFITALLVAILIFALIYWYVEHGPKKRSKILSFEWEGNTYYLVYVYRPFDSDFNEYYYSMNSSAYHKKLPNEDTKTLLALSTYKEALEVQKYIEKYYEISKPKEVVTKVVKGNKAHLDDLLDGK